MKTLILVLSLLTGMAHAQKTVTVEMLTSISGDPIVIELNQEKAPETVKNFLSYVDDKFYDGTIFHRVIDGFMIQGGGYSEGMKEKKTKAPIKNEASNGLKNTEGSIAMARTMDPHSATAQFYINVANNSSLDHVNTTNQGYGYAVFGKVVKGMHVVNRIKAVKTGSIFGHQNVPMDTITIKSVRRLVRK